MVVAVWMQSGPPRVRVGHLPVVARHVVLLGGLPDQRVQLRRVGPGRQQHDVPHLGPSGLHGLHAVSLFLKNFQTL